MFQLKSWEVLHGFCYGNVFGNPRFSDGTRIHTSSIMEVKVDEKNSQLVVRTKSNNFYHMKFQDINIFSEKETKDELKKWGIDGRIIDRCLQMQIKEELLYKEQLKSKIKPRELYVVTSGVYPVKAYFLKEDGELVDVQISHHVGMFQDSILFCKHGVVDFRIFPNWNMEIYHWSDGLDSVLFENVGNDFKIQATNKRIPCKKHEIAVVRAEDYTGDGLISPDCVNGKSAFLK